MGRKPGKTLESRMCFAGCQGFPSFSSGSPEGGEGGQEGGSSGWKGRNSHLSTLLRSIELGFADLRPCVPASKGFFGLHTGCEGDRGCGKVGGEGHPRRKDGGLGPGLERLEAGFQKGESLLGGGRQGEGDGMGGRTCEGSTDGLCDIGDSRPEPSHYHGPIPSRVEAGIFMAYSGCTRAWSAAATRSRGSTRSMW